LDAASHGEYIDRRVVLPRGRNENCERHDPWFMSRARGCGWWQRDRSRRLGTIRTAARSGGLEWPSFGTRVNQWPSLMCPAGRLPRGDMDIVTTRGVGVARQLPNESHHGQHRGQPRLASEVR